MTVKILIKRHFKREHLKEGIQLLHAFRELALNQAGYISGETLVDHYDDSHITVVSAWQSVDDWVRWQDSPDRQKKEDKLESFLDQPTIYEIYDIYQGRD